MPLPWTTRTSRMPFSRHAARYSVTTSFTSCGRNVCRSSTPSMGRGMGSDIFRVACGRGRDASRIFLGVQEARNRTAGFLEAREVPQVRKIPALLRLHGLNGTVVATEEHTFAVGLLIERQAAPIFCGPGKAPDELDFAETGERGEARDLPLVQPHFSRPSATGSATLTFVEDGPQGRIRSNVPGSTSKERPSSGLQ